MYLRGKDKEMVLMTTKSSLAQTGINYGRGQQSASYF